jgi:hypothetical protein
VIRLSASDVQVASPRAPAVWRTLENFPAIANENDVERKQLATWQQPQAGETTALVATHLPVTCGLHAECSLGIVERDTDQGEALA